MQSANCQQQNPNNWQDKVISDRDIDFGVCKDGSEQKHKFVLSNPGNEKLFIHSVQSSCGCFKVSFDEQEIEPGGSVNLWVTADTENFTRSKSSSITVRFKNPHREIQLSAKIDIRNFSLSPNSLVIDSGKDSSLIFEIEAEDSEFTIGSVQSSTADLSAKIASSEVAGGKSLFRLKASYHGEPRAKAVREWIYLPSKINPKLIQQLPILITPPRDSKQIDATPKQLRFNRNEDLRGIERKLILKSPNQTQIKSVDLSCDSFKVTANKDKRSATHVIRVTSKDLTNAGNESFLVVKFDDGTQQKVEIFVK
ncbi:MAG: DUF1573 domain-containing protein [Planctomycetota bacterium]